MLVAKDVFPRGLTFDECLIVLKELPFIPVAVFLAELSMTVEKAFESTFIRRKEQWVDVHRFMARMFKPVALARAKASITPESLPFAPLSPQAIYATLELAGRFCRRDSRMTQVDADERESVSHIILSFQEEALSTRLQEEFKTFKSWEDGTPEVCAEFIRNRIANNPNRNYADAMARLMAFANQPYIAGFFYKRTKIELSAWFLETLAMSVESYLVVSFLAGTLGNKFSPEDPDPSTLIHNDDTYLNSLPDPLAKLAKVLFKSATISERELKQGTSASTELSDVMYSSTQLLRTPIISFGSWNLVTSATLLSNQFLVGLPHSLLKMVEARKQEPLNDSEVKGIRGYFGHVLEGYIQWLMSTWFKNRDVKLFSNYIVTANKGAERDIAILWKQVLFLFEIKGTVYDLGLRSEGAFTKISRFIAGPVKQAYSAAEAFENEEVVDESGNDLKPEFQLIIPIAVVYDPIPLAVVTGDHFEKWLEADISKKVFTTFGRIAPTQMVSLEDLEMCEHDLRLDFRPELLLEKILIRHKSPVHRFTALSSMGRKIDMPRRDSPLFRLRKESESFLRNTIRDQLRQKAESESSGGKPNN